MEYTRFDKDDLMACMTDVGAAIRTANLPNARKKYEHENYLSVSSAIILPSVHYVSHGRGRWLLLTQSLVRNSEEAIMKEDLRQITMGSYTFTITDKIIQ